MSHAQPRVNNRGGDHDDDLFGKEGFGVGEHNFKSQTLQFQTNLGSDFINLFAPSEQGQDKDNVSSSDEPDTQQFNSA